jgi:dienelactone hydrolase
LKIDVKVPAEGEIELGAWLFLPKGDGIRPAITMAHGFAGTKEHGLERFAQAFAAAGFVVLVHVSTRRSCRNRMVSRASAQSRREPFVTHVAIHSAFAVANSDLTNLS